MMIYRNPRRIHHLDEKIKEPGVSYFSYSSIAFLPTIIARPPPGTKFAISFPNSNNSAFENEVRSRSVILRVRSTASANGQEVGQVKPGDVLTMVEEIPNWYRVRLSDGKEGFISAAYASKKQ
jgi:hypothetical protein